MNGIMNYGFIVNELHFRGCVSDSCVHVKKSRGNRTILVFVNDIIVGFNQQDEEEWTEYKIAMSRKYKVRNLGEADWLLQMKITRDQSKETVILDQQTYNREDVESIQYEPM